MRFLLVVLLVLAGCGQTHVSGPSLIAFHATWCQSCQRDKPLLAEVTREFPVTEIDFESQRFVSTRYHVSVLPTYIVFLGEREVMRTMNLGMAFQTLRYLNQR